MPTPRRRQSFPPLPSLPPVRLAPIRSEGSVELDQEVTRTGLELPPFVRFDRFMEKWDWRQGEHVTTIGPTGSGKTVLNRQLLRRRDYVVVLGVKQRDVELYGPFQREGYELVHRFSPVPPDEAEQSHVLFVPRMDASSAEERASKASKAFRNVLNEIYLAGGWTVYADDIQYMAHELRLDRSFRELWQLGRSEGVSVVASSQEPVDIPVMAYGQATHLFLFHNPDRYRAERMAQLTGLNREVTEHTILRLPKHEFLFINKNSGEMLRSKVIRRA